MSEEKESKKSKINWSAEKVMSISALFISAISLFALFYQLNLAREENELIRKQQSASVLPHLGYWYSNSSEGFKIIFGNKGVGPAFIKKVDMVLDDSIHFSTSDLLFRHVFSNAKGLDSVQYSNSTLAKGYVLPANEKMEVIVIKNRKGIKIFKDYMDAHKLDFSIFYEDVYGTRWKLGYSQGFSVPELVPKKE